MTIHHGLLADLPVQVHTIILLGRRTSDHLRELARIAEHKGRLAYRIEAAADLQPRWFAGEEHVGLIVGAADLAEEEAAVIARLEQFDSAQRLGQLEGRAA